MNLLVATLTLILLALLGARFSFSSRSVSPGPRLLFRTGTHFLFVGFILGPHVLGLMSTDAVEQLFPVLALGLGWVGFLFGMQLDLDSLRQFDWRLYAFSFGQALLTFLLFAGAGWAVLLAAGIEGEVPRLLLLGAAAIASVSTPAGIATVSANFLVRGNVRTLLFFGASVDALVGVAALQVIYAFYHPAELVLGFGGSAAAGWVVAALGIGVVLGILFLWLIRPNPGPEERVLFLVGISALAAGSALHLHLSPLFVTIVMGALVSNLVPDRQRVFAVLERWEKPIYLLLLLLAGAYLQFPTLWVLPMAIGYAVVRGAAKTVASAALVRAVRLPFPTPGRVGLGMIPQGGIATAMAVSAMLTYTGLELGDMDPIAFLFAVVVLGIVLSELVGPFFVVQVLRRAGEISPRVERALAEGDEGRAQEEAMRHSVEPPVEG